MKARKGRLRIRTRNLPDLQARTLPLSPTSHTYYYEEEDNLFPSEGPDGGFHSGYDQAGTYAGTQENAETTSIVIIAFSNLSTTSPFPSTFFSIPPWIIYLFTGLAVAAVAVVATVLVLDQRRRKLVFANTST